VFRRLLLVVLLLHLPAPAAAQGLTGALIGTVKDEQGLPIQGAVARVSSPALINAAFEETTNEKGQLQFLALPSGVYALDITFRGFASRHEDGIVVGAGATIGRWIVLVPAAVAQSIVVDGSGSRMDARDPGFGTRFGPEDLRVIPSRRASMFDPLRNVPGVSPTSPSSGTVTTISAFGSGTNENQFLIDGTNTTCPCNGVARSEPGVDFIQEVQVQAVGASAEFGNVQGAVVNVITRQGSDRFLYDASYYGQPSSLTAQPVRLKYDNGQRESGYVRSRYRDFTSNAGGPAVRGRLWLFGGYQYLRDYDSQPGTDPASPRTYEQNKFFAKLTWQLAPGWQLMQSFHEEAWVSPDQPRVDRPIETTTRSEARVPAMTFGHLTHIASSSTVWDVRAGRFVYDVDSPPTNGDTSTASHLDALTNVLSGAPPSFGAITLIRTTGKATISHYRSGLWHADHAFKAGGQIERGEHQSPNVIPTGVRYTDRNGPFNATFADPTNTGGEFVTEALFATDAITIGDRLTINAGLRFDHSRAISQDLYRVDLQGNETATLVQGAGTLFSWNIVSPRMGLTMKLTADGRTMLRASYGRFSQGVLTGEIGAFHPGATATTTKAYVPADGDYTRVTQLNDPASLQIAAGIRPPRTDEYSAGVDREIGRSLHVAGAYIHKSGANFIGWEEIDPKYATVSRPLADGSRIDVYDRLNGPYDQRFLLTNPAGYSMTYDGLVIAAEKRHSHGWQAFGSLTLSRVTGLQAGSGTNAAGAQVSTVAPPPGPSGLTFGRDPNDLTNARGRLANDRPRVFRAMSSVNVPRTGLVLAANIQYFSGKPWAASAQVPLSQNQNQRVLLEPRGTRRLSSQTLLDFRVSRPIAFSKATRVELLFDVLNALNSAAEESIISDVQMTASAFNSTFGQPNAFVDPRRVMLGVRLNLGR
jgi:TonB dependent receptor-like, beta-barrel/Carboxypeptidase regulatory-like domain